MKTFCLFFFTLVLTPVFGFQEDPNRFIRTTEAQAPEDERKGFHVPEGFEVQLFADDAQVGGKPINMAFDSRGRLWVTSTQEYPFAVKKEKWSADTASAPGSKDTIRVLEDTDGDGRADKVTVFATDLNIPTGVLPYKNGCIAWSIPNILFLEDTRAAGNDKTQNTKPNELPAPTKADKRTILFGPLGYERDTHGMISSFRLGLDGWVYATHGFSNTSHFEVRPEHRQSTTEGTENTKNAGTKKTSVSSVPSVVKSGAFDITSGSVFRFKPDGSAVELWTSGQVNPFGLCWDSWGNLYSADCHSSPIYQLIRGACYPSFGRPHDGLGFGPVMCEHAHGSTGICGPVYIDGGIWGADWDDHMFVCNPVTSKINHDLITFTGATPKANEKPDFLTSDDTWFRPVDLQLGPDSALYIADFYNRIIGHYEVPLDHPGRDRSSGRIWRVVKKGSTGKLKDGDLSKMTVDALEAKCGSEANLTLRNLGVTELAERTANKLNNLSKPRFVAEAEKARPMPPETKARLLQYIWQSIDDVGGEDLWALLEDLAQTPPNDLQLRHLIRVDLRRCLKWDGAYKSLASSNLKPSDKLELIKVSNSVPSEDAAVWLLDQLRATVANGDLQEGRNRGQNFAVEPPSYTPPLLGLDLALFRESLTHIARYLPAARDSELIELVQRHLGNDLDTQLDLFDAVRQGKKEQKSRSGESLVKAADPLKAWADKLARQLTESLQRKEVSDWQVATPPSDVNPSPWFKQTRKCSDGTERAFLCSLPPGGEKLTGTLRSKAFDLPKTLSFWIAGHRGFPKTEAHDKNVVRLVDEATGVEIAKAYPPRNDMAQLVKWELSETSSKRGHLELVDGDNGTAYAWLATGGFSPEVVGIPDLNSPVNDKRIRAAAELAATWETHESPDAQIKRYASPAYPGLVSRLRALPHPETYSADTRVALARISILMPFFMADEVAQLARDPDLAVTVFKVLDEGDDHTALTAAFKTLPSRSQIKLASALASSGQSANLLFKVAAPSVLADPLVSGKLNALNDAGITRQLKAATALLPPQNDALNKLIAERLKAFDPAKADAAKGQDIFMRTCSVCHRIGVKGNLVGPQLDGVGARGAERLIEDIMDPNRAVDPAFRLHIVKLKSGGLLTGLFRREQDSEVVYCDAADQEHSVKKTEVADDQVSAFSLMPSGFGEVLKAEELHDLMAYLLQRKS